MPIHFIIPIPSENGVVDTDFTAEGSVAGLGGWGNHVHDGYPCVWAWSTGMVAAPSATRAYWHSPLYQVSKISPKGLLLVKFALKVKKWLDYGIWVSHMVAPTIWRVTAAAKEVTWRQEVEVPDEWVSYEGERAIDLPSIDVTNWEAFEIGADELVSFLIGHGEVHAGSIRVYGVPKYDTVFYVHDQRGYPLPNATVVMKYSDTKVEVARGVTGTDGKAILRAWSASYVAEISHAQGSVTKDFDLKADNQAVDVEIPTGVDRNVVATVLGPASAPLPAATVDIYYKGALVDSALTDTYGKAYFKLKDGTYGVFASKTGYTVDEKTIIIPDTLQVTLSLQYAITAYRVKLRSVGDSAINFGKITVDGIEYDLPKDISLLEGEHTVTGTPPEGFSWNLWEPSDGISVKNPASQTTIMTVTGEGTLKAHFALIPVWPWWWWIVAAGGAVTIITVVGVVAYQEYERREMMLLTLRR